MGALHENVECCVCLLFSILYIEKVSQCTSTYIGDTFIHCILSTNKQQVVFCLTIHRPWAIAHTLLKVLFLLAHSWKYLDHFRYQNDQDNSIIIGSEKTTGMTLLEM